MPTGYKDFNLISPADGSTINGVIRVEYSYTQSIANNTSTVTVTGIKFMSKNYYLTWFYANGRIKVGSLNIDFKNGGTSDGCSVQAQNTWYELGSNKTGGQFTVNHDSGGNGSFSIQITYNPSSYQGGDTTNFWIYCDADWHGNGRNSGSATVTLDRINRQFTLSISAGTGSSITVKRNNVVLSNGASITYGDVLVISFAATTGYNLGTHTVNGSAFNSGGSHTVTGAVSVISTATLKTFTLSISAGSNSSITVKRSNTTLSNGATITYGDVLVITFAASAGYNVGTHTVNGSTFTSGASHTVKGAVTVISTATLKTFTLSISAGTNTSITVNRTSSPLGNGSTGNLSNGATIYYNDKLTISFSVSTGCQLSTHTVNGSAFTSGGSHTVTGAVTVVSTATVNSFTLSISAGSHSPVTVNRTSSPKQGAAQGYLNSGDTIYYGDVLSISYSVSTGYNIGTHTLNGNSFTSGVSHTVTAAVSVVTTATVKTFTITKTVGTGMTLTIRRTSSPNGGGSIGILTGNTVYYGDVLELTASADAGYNIESTSINGNAYTDNPHMHTVTSAVTIVIVSKVLGFIYIDSGAGIERYRILIDSGSAMEQYRAMIDTGSEIIPY